jgi:hypothetical protein
MLLNLNDAQVKVFAMFLIAHSTLSSQGLQTTQSRKGVGIKPRQGIARQASEKGRRWWSFQTLWPLVEGRHGRKQQSKLRMLPSLVLSFL